jgi:hypothetical protein
MINSRHSASSLVQSLKGTKCRRGPVYVGLYTTRGVQAELEDNTSIGPVSSDYLISYRMARVEKRMGGLIEHLSIIDYAKMRKVSNP